MELTTGRLILRELGEDDWQDMLAHPFLARHSRGSGNDERAVFGGCHWCAHHRFVVLRLVNVGPLENDREP